MKKTPVVISVIIAVIIALSSASFLLYKNQKDNKDNKPSIKEEAPLKNDKIEESTVDNPLEEELEEKDKQPNNFEDKTEENEKPNSKPNNSTNNNKPTKPEDKLNDSNSNTKPNSSNNSNGTNSNNSSTDNSKPTNENDKDENTSSPSNELTIDEPVDEVNELRKKIEDTYSVTIKYGDEIGNYRPKGLTPYKLQDKDKIKTALNTMNYELSKYPKGFFKEMKDNEMPVTFYLVSSVPNNSFDGFTDHELMTDIKITIVTNTLMSFTLNHEIMHYIDCYLEIKTWPNNHYEEYMSLNPNHYNYGVTNTDYTYGYDKNVEDIYFISDYSQTNVREDRAEIFKYIMTRSYMLPKMFDKDEVTTKKALIIDKQIRENFQCAKGTLYWDKFIKK